MHWVLQLQQVPMNINHHTLHTPLALVFACFLLMLVNQKTLYSLLLLTIELQFLSGHIHIIIAMHTYIFILFTHVAIYCVYVKLIIIVCTNCLWQLYGCTVIL